MIGRIRTLYILLLILLHVGCATVDPAQRAYVVARSSNEVVETAYAPWDTYVRERLASCLKRLPPAEHTQAEFDACLGTAAQHDTLVVPMLELYHAAALALYVALTVGNDDRQIIEAQRELARATLELVRKIPTVDAQIRKAQTAIEGS